MNYLCHDVYGLNYKRANDIVKSLDLHNLQDLIKLKKTDLTKIEGIGEKIADKILNTIKEDLK